MVQFARQVAVTRHAPRADLYAPELFRALRLCETASEYAAADPVPDSASDPFTDVDALEELEEEIVILAAHIHAAEHRLLVLVAEFDRRRGWELGGQDLRPLARLPYRDRPRGGAAEGAGGPGAGRPARDERRDEPGRAVLLGRPGAHPGGDA